MPIARSSYQILLLIVVSVALHGCGRIQPILSGKQHPHEQYRNDLQKAGLDGTALVREWEMAAEKALRDTVIAITPMQEVFYFAAGSATAFGYRLEGRRGEKIQIRTQVTSVGPINVFVDLFELDEGVAEHIASAERTELEFICDRNGIYVVRVQPELLRSAQVTITITKAPSLDFPVAGHTGRSIRSFFGDARDAGKRRHEGVDVFAPRGTPLIAVADGIARSGNNRLGGKVVWLYDPDRNLNLYYAHLDSQYVGMLSQVKIGDTLGTVGNTGNAKHTPPHLHFGIYARGEGAVDPLPYLNTPETDPKPVTADRDLLGKPVRVRSKQIDLRIAPNEKAAKLATIPRNSFLNISGATKDLYRVEYGGMSAYVRSKDLELIDAPLKKIDLKENAVLFDQPGIGSVPIADLQKGEKLELLAIIGGFQHVRTADDRIGWIIAEQ